jgi:uncharacterized protein (TIGR00255 family)
MLRSMTGYGRSEYAAEQGDIIVEVKSSNHRFCDISLRMPQRCFALEHEIKKLILARLKRGRIDLSIQFENKEQEELNVGLNLPLAQRYYILFKELKEMLKLPGEITLNQLVTQKDIIVSQSANERSHLYRSGHAGENARNRRCTPTGRFSCTIKKYRTSA